MYLAAKLHIVQQLHYLGNWKLTCSLLQSRLKQILELDEVGKKRYHSLSILHSSNSYTIVQQKAMVTFLFFLDKS